MIFYVTKETFERYKLKMPHDMQSTKQASVAQGVIDKEAGDRFLEWGGKLFYFERRKCLQVSHFASKLTIFLIDIKVAELKNISGLFAAYMFDLYAGNEKIQILVEKYFEEHSTIAFAHIKDKSAISTLNRNQTFFLEDGNLLYNYVRNGILRTRELNKDINHSLFTRKVNGKTEYFEPVELFAQRLEERYGQ